MPKTTEQSCTIRPQLVEQLEGVQAKRRKIDAEARAMKASEDAVKHQIKLAMGRFRRAAIGSTGRFIELTTIDQPERVIKGYSYTLLKIVGAVE